MNRLLPYQEKVQERIMELHRRHLYVCFPLRLRDVMFVLLSSGCCCTFSSTKLSNIFLTSAGMLSGFRQIRRFAFIKTAQTVYFLLME